MEHKNKDTGSQQHSRLGDLKRDLMPGRADRNLFSAERQEAPIDNDAPMSASSSTDAGDETYEDEDMDRNYFEERAGNNVRK